MSKKWFSRILKSPLKRFGQDTRGTISLELVLVMPILLWVLVAMTIFFDAYRARMQTQTAVLQVADLISRNTNVITDEYLEGMNVVLDYMVQRNLQTRIRVSAIAWDTENERLMVRWSYGTRNMMSLTELAQMEMLAQIGDGSGGGDDGNGDGSNGFDFDNVDMQMPVDNLADRIPRPFQGETLILVESFALWRSPIVRWMGFDYLNNVRFMPLAVTRPRFSPFIRYEHADEEFPIGGPEFFPDPDDVDDPTPEDPEEPEEPSSTVTIVDTDFTDGDTSNWSVGSDRITQLGSDSYLGRFGQETWNNPLTYQLNLGQESSSALIEFDLLIIDSWDAFSTQWAHPEGEFLTILVNGTSISLDAFQHNLENPHTNDRLTVSSRAEGRFTTTMELIQSGINFAGTSYTDQIWRVRIEVENPAEVFELGFAARLDEGIDNESFGLLNFRVTAEHGGHEAPHFVPNWAQFAGVDPLTRFATFSGCPEMQIPAPAMTIYNSDLTAPLRMRRRAGGATNYGNCGMSGVGRFGRANPVMVLHYTNDTSNINGNLLRFRTNDFNNGNSCDATLLIRDPYGAWNFNSEISDSNYNARINLGHAASGEYHIWMGNWDTGNCQTDLIIERY